MTVMTVMGDDSNGSNGDNVGNDNKTTLKACDADLDNP